jgi:hypothetical protein
MMTQERARRLFLPSLRADGHKYRGPAGEVVVAMAFRAGDFRLGPAFAFESRAGVAMVCRAGDVLAKPPDESEILRIEAATFRSSYRPAR